MNIESILSKSDPIKPSVSSCASTSMPTLDPLWQQYAMMCFQQAMAANNFQASMSPGTVNPMMAFNPMFFSQMFQPQVPSSPKSTPACTSPSSKYSIESLLAAPQNLKTQVTPYSQLLHSSFNHFAKPYHRPKTELRPHVNRESSKPLRQWMEAHIHDPYPTTAEVTELCAITGFEYKQVRDWFTNNRRRLEQKLKKKKQPIPWVKREPPKVTP